MRTKEHTVARCSTVYQGGPATWRAFEEPVHTGFPTWPVAPTRRPLSIETATHKQSTAWMKKARISTAHDGGRATWKGSKAEATQTYFKINEQIVQAAVDKKKLSKLLDDLCRTDEQLNVVNVVTILHRGAKLRVQLPALIAHFLCRRDSEC